MTPAGPLLASDPVGLGGGRYRVEGVLGRGGAASVYEVWDRQVQVHRAAKVLRPELAQDPGTREAFLMEARKAARLSHPHVVTVHDVGQDGGACFVVMELVRGGSLQGLVGRRVPLEQVCTLLLQVLDGLSHAHAAGLVHGDVRPANILLASKTRALLTDFGMVGTAGQGSGAPEQREGRGQTDARVDVYGVGATLYALITGRAPTELHSLSPGDRRLAGLSPALAEVVRKATARSPVARYATAQDLAAALREAARVSGASLDEELLTGAFDPVELASPEALTSAEPTSPEAETTSEPLHVRPRPITKEPLKGPERGRGKLGPVRAGPSETPRKIWRVESRTSVLASPTHWGGEEAPPALQPEDEATLPEGGRKVLLWLAGGALLVALVLGAVVLRPELVDELLARLEHPVDSLSSSAARQDGGGSPSLAVPVPDAALAPGADEIIIEVVGTGGGFRDAVAECGNRAPVVRRLVRGVATLPRLHAGEACEVGLRGNNTAYATGGPFQPGTAIACRYAGKGVVCTSRP